MYIVCYLYYNSFIIFILYIYSCLALFSHCTAGHCEFLLRGINKGLSYLILSYLILVALDRSVNVRKRDVLKDI